MLAAATAPLLLILAYVVLVAFGAWPFGPLFGVVLVLGLLALAVALVRLSGRMSGPEPPHPRA
jgi:hypothetical protein